MIVTGEQLRAARAMSRLEQSELAERAEISVDTVKRLERTVGPISANVATMARVVAALESAGVEFTNGGEPGVKMKFRTYRLRPIPGRLWSGSVADPIYLVALSASAARTMAASRLPVPGSSSVAASPWMADDHATCEEVERPTWPKEIGDPVKLGPGEIRGEGGNLISSP